MQYSHPTLISFYFLYRDSSKPRTASLKTCHWTSFCNICTYTAWWKPPQARRCNSCPVWGSGNVAGCSSVGISSESNLWGSEVRTIKAVEKNRPWGKRQHTCGLSGVDKRCTPLRKYTSKLSGKLNIMSKKRPTCKVQGFYICFSDPHLFSE